MMQTIEATGPNAAQIEYWNREAGAKWVAFQELMDKQIEGFGHDVMERLAPAPGERLLDVGCGCGQTALELAARVGDSGHVTAVDISAPMLARTRQRIGEAGLGNVDVINADAATYPLPEAAFDAVFSRFGVMFFADPVAAFGNLRRALKPTGRIAFACWRTLPENPWAALPIQAVADLIDIPKPEPGAPGPFSMADRARIESILKGAGFADIAIAPLDRKVAIGGTGTLAEINRLIIRLGPVSRLLADADEDTIKQAETRTCEALTPYYDGMQVTLPGAAWICMARATA